MKLLAGVLPMLAVTGGVEPGVFFAASMAVAAAVVLAWAWHGRQVDAHPFCRRCGFSLLGRTPHMLPACPECGADLSHRRAVRVGRRRRRRPVIAASGLVIGLSTAYVAVSTSTQAKGFDWLGHKPFGWVVADANAVDGRTHDAALAELARRIRAGEMSPAKQKALVEQALARQADLNRPWAPGWGEIVEASRAAGWVSNEQWERYKLQSVTFVLAVVQPRVRDTKDLRLELARGPDRLSARSTVRLELGLFVEPNVVISGQPVPAEAERTGPDRRPRHVGSPVEMLGLLDVPGLGQSDVERLAKVAVGSTSATLGDGPQTLRLPVVVRPLTVTSTGQERMLAYDPGPAQRRVELEAKWELLPRESLEELVGPEFKGVWVPAAHRAKVMQDAAKRREARTSDASKR